MGNMQAASLAEAAKDGTFSLSGAVHAHLRSNHFPPVSSAFLPVALAAIGHANEGEWDIEQTYPNGLARTVAHTIDGLHLEAFLSE